MIALNSLCMALRLTISFLIPGPDYWRNLVPISVLSAAMACFFLWTSHYCVPGGANCFTEYAEVLANGGAMDAGALAQRDLGFPLLLWLTGYCYTHSFIGITILHAIFAILIPILIYLTIGEAFPVAAFGGAVAAIASMLPYQFMKWIHHDQAYVFLTVLFVYVATRYARTPGYRHLYTLTVVAMLVSITRPAGNAVFPAALCLAYVIKPQKLVPFALCAGLFVTCTIAYKCHRQHFADAGPGGEVPSYTGQQIFFNLYLHSAENGIHLSEDLGSSTRELANVMRRLAAPTPRESPFLKSWVDEYLHIGMFDREFAEKQFRQFTPDGLVHAMFEHPNWEYYLSWCDGAQDDKLFLRASAEIVRRYPLYPVKYTLNNLWLFFTRPGYAHPRGCTLPLCQEPRLFYPGRPTDISSPVGSEQTVAELRVADREHFPVAIQWLFRQIEACWVRYHLCFITVTFVLLVVAVISALLSLAASYRIGGEWLAGFSAAVSGEVLWQPVLFAAGVLLYNAVITCAFADPSYRYYYFVALLQVICAAFGLAVCLRMMKCLAGNWSRAVAVRGVHGRAVGQLISGLRTTRETVLRHGWKWEEGVRVRVATLLMIVAGITVTNLVLWAVHIYRIVY